LKKPDVSAGGRQNGNVTIFDPQRRIKGLTKPMRRANGEVYLSAITVDFYQFDAAYLRLLQQGDRATQDHFFRYFSDILRIKLRNRNVAVDVIKDIQQETFLRVLVAVRTNEIRQPEGLGSFVNSTCNNVLKEHYREVTKNQHVDLDGVDVADTGADLERKMMADEQARTVQKVLTKLGERDGAVLRALLQGRDKEEICRELSVDRGYLRVLTHRAIENFKYQCKTKKVASRMRHAVKR